jgi:hypothetical protein
MMTMMLMAMLPVLLIMWRLLPMLVIGALRWGVATRANSFNSGGGVYRVTCCTYVTLTLLG